MASKREKLEKKARDLGLEFVSETTDEELQDLITDNSDDSDVRYFKSKVANLKVIVGEPDYTKGEVAPQYERFVPYWAQELGVEGSFKQGYLSTSSGSALKKLVADPSVVEIDQDEFEEATQDDNRAPY